MAPSICHSTTASGNDPIQYWKRRLAGCSASPYPWVDIGECLSSSLPLDEHACEFNTAVISLPLCQNEFHVSVNFYAAWSLVLASYTGAPDVCFGLATRHVDALDARVVYPFRNPIPENTTCKRFLEATEKRINQDGKHKDVYVQSFLSMDSTWQGCLDTRHLVEVLDGEGPTSKSESLTLKIQCLIDANSIQIEAIYSLRCIKEDEVKRLLLHVRKVFEQLSSADCSKKFVHEIDFFGEEDLAQIQKWNTANLEPVECCLHSAFEATAAEFPEMPALQSHEKQLTYRQLDNLANGLARQITRHNFQQTYLPICFEKSIEMVIATIAVLKANKAFVPIDPNQPSEKIHTILEQVNASLVLASPSYGSIAGDNRQVITVSAEALSTMDKEMVAPLDLHSSHLQPAYVLFTSGSTGKPKGVVIEHQSITTALIRLGQKLDLNSKTKMFQYTSYTFDPSLLEIFGTLIHGGCVCIPSEDERLNDITQTIAKMDVNTAIFVPSVLKTLRPDEIPTVRKLIIGGESLPRSLVKVWKDRHVINAYGPTETCIASVVNLEVADELFGNNIGRPVACRAWVVNPKSPSQLLPIGCVGELVIEGPTVSSGYLGESEKANSKFHASAPWKPESKISQRMYQTGDLVRYLPNGKLHYMARLDQQVKINGQRVELGEIEAQIHDCEHVKDVVVQSTESHGSDFLLAFVMLDSSLPGISCEFLEMNPKLKIVLDSVWDRLQTRLSPTMVPKYIIPVSVVPQRTTGKIDMEHLMNLFEIADCEPYLFGYQEIKESDRQPTAHEITLRNLWNQVLNVREVKVSAADNFLHLGGNSIKAIHLVSLARHHGIRLNVQIVLRYPRLRDMANEQLKLTETVSVPVQKIDLNITESSNSSTAVHPSESSTTYDATPIQSLCLMTGHLFPEGNYTRLLYRAEGFICKTRLENACKQLIERNEILRTEFCAPDESGRITASVVENGSSYFLSFVSLPEAEKHLKSFKPNYIAQPMTEFCFVVSGHDQVSHFSIGLHHSQFDAWSMNILLRQLQNLFNGHPQQAGPSFSRFAKEMIPKSNDTDTESFWQHLLDGSTPTVIGSGSPISDQPTGIREEEIDFVESRDSFTFAVVLYTAWALALHRKSQNPDIVFFGLVSGRNLNIEGFNVNEVVGPCLNVIPTRVRLQKCTFYRDVLEDIRNSMLDSIPHESMPMNKIIERCTSWDPAGIMGSMIQHSDIDIESTESIATSSNSQSVPWRMLKSERQFGGCIGTDLYLTSKAQPGGSVKLVMKYNPARLQTDFADSLFVDFVATIGKILRNPDNEIEND